MSDWTSGEPQIATEADCRGKWGCAPDGLRFRCDLCGHRFVPGDVWRFVAANGLAIGGMGIPNAMVCGACDGEDVRERLRSHWQEALTRFWFLFEDVDLKRAAAEGAQATSS